MSKGEERTSPGQARGARFRRMVEDLRVIIWESDEALRVKFVSGRAAVAFGYPVREWTDSPDIWRVLVHPEDYAGFVASARAVVATGEESELEFRAVRADGAVVWVRSLLGGAAGARRGVRLRGVMLDVTDRRHAEASARQYAERMRRLLDHAVDPLLVHDRRGRIVEVNLAACEALGYTRRELLERGLSEIQPGFDPSTDGAMWAQIRPGHGRAEEARYQRRDGTTLPVSVQRSLLEWEGQSLFVVLCRDQTERIRLEAQLRQSQKLEEVGRLTGGLAHDFHNMLTAIKGHAALLLQDAEASPGRADLELIANAADRATVLTRKLLAFSRRDSTGPEALDLNALVLETTRLLGPLIGEHIEARTELAAEGWVVGSPSQFEQVLVNLVVNARDAMPAGGVLTIATSNLTVGPLPLHRFNFVRAGRYVVLRVTDTGHGMDAATLERVFEPFFTTKDPDKGSGLGLSTVFGIVKEAGGYILADSRPGEGSTFTVLLPCAAAPRPKPAPEPLPVERPPAPMGERTVLVVEDEPAVRSLIRRILERDGHRVLEAEDGENALAVSRGYEHAIDLLITDVLMPGMGGPALTRILGAERPGLRVILTSGYGDDIVADERGPGRALFLEKPFSPDDLGGAVRTVFAAPAPELAKGAPEA